MRRLLAAGLLPGRAGQPVKAWVHISLADLLLLDADSALQEQWTARVQEHPPVGLDPGSQSGRDDDGVEQGQEERCCTATDRRSGPGNGPGEAEHSRLRSEF
jgi:hypothetical protein